MIIGVIVFSILFVLFVALGTLLLCDKGYFLISGYRTLSNEEKTQFVEKNNLKKTFLFYAMYCYAVALVTLVALIGACCNNMVTVFVSYLLFGAGTVAALIVLNATTTFKIVPLHQENVVLSNKKIEVEGKDEVESAPVVVEEVKVEEQPVVEEKPAPAKKPTTAKKSTSTKLRTGTKPATTKTTTKKATATKTATKENTEE